MKAHTSTRTCLITGGTSGVGFAVALDLARRGEQVVVTSRSRQHGESAAAIIAQKTGSANVSAMELDLSEPRSVAAFAADFRSRYSSLQLLSLNAGIVSFKPAVTSLGCSRVFAVNYLGHFYLTTLLLDMLEASAPSRVIAVAGNAGAIRNLHVDLSSICGSAPYQPVRDALNAALLKTMFIFELARRTAGTGITANAFHPGLVKSRLGSAFPFPLNVAAGLGNIFMSSRCRTGEYLASSPEVEGASGGFYEKSRLVDLRLSRHTGADYPLLWARSEDLISSGKET